ncbi:hypothetical protein PSY62_23780, partial [Shigella flexneri]|nr:hypothetical protein [Shigella flexneri]
GCVLCLDHAISYLTDLSFSCLLTLFIKKKYDFPSYGILNSLSQEVSQAKTINKLPKIKGFK